MAQRNNAIGATVQVVLDRDDVTAGDLLTGQIRLHVDKLISNSTLSVRVSGYERMTWTGAADGRWFAGAQARHSHSWKYLDDEIMVVATDTTGPWQVGEEYSYPFEFQLPADCPPGFKFDFFPFFETEHLLVTMKYSVTATLDMTHQGVGLTPLVDEKAFLVQAKEPTTTPTGKVICATTTEKIRALGVVNKGTCTLQLATPTDVYTPSSTMEAQVNLTLVTTKQLEFATLALYQDITVDKQRRFMRGKNHMKRLACCRRYGVALGDGMEMKMALPFFPHNFRPTDHPLPPSMETHFLSLGYRVSLECGFSKAYQIKLDAPVQLVHGPAKADCT